MGARRLGQDEQYLTVREILSEASTLADGVLSRERSGFCRCGLATLGLILPLLQGKFSQELKYLYPFQVWWFLAADALQDPGEIEIALW